MASTFRKLSFSLMSMTAPRPKLRSMFAMASSKAFSRVLACFVLGISFSSSVGLAVRLSMISCSRVAVLWLAMRIFLYVTSSVG